MLNPIILTQLILQLTTYPTISSFHLFFQEYFNNCEKNKIYSHNSISYSHKISYFLSWDYRKWTSSLKVLVYKVYSIRFSRKAHTLKKVLFRISWDLIGLGFGYSLCLVILNLLPIIHHCYFAIIWCIFLHIFSFC